MSSDERDPILDACLDEILGGQTPPDLTPRIMQAWSMLPPALPVEPSDAPPVQNPVRIKAASKPSTPPGTARSPVTVLSVSLVLAATVVVVGLGIGFALRPMPSTVESDDVVQNVVRPSQQPVDQPLPGRSQEKALVANSPTRPRQESPEVITPDFSAQPPFATGDGQQQNEFAVLELPRVAALDDAEVVAGIDAAIKMAWQRQKVTPAPRAGDDVFANHLFQRVLGRDPTAADLQAFVASRDKNKRTQLVDELLTREDNVVEFARHWSAIWAEALMGREGTLARTSASREGLQQYLRRALQQAKPLDQITTELLTATGSGEIGSAEYNGAANFLLTHHDNQATQATAQVARVFLGKRIQCAQCHDHPGDATLAQRRFWELNTFFRQLTVQGRGGGAAPLLANRDFHGDGGGNGGDAEVFYETASGQIKVAYPALPGIVHVPRSGLVEEFDRRAGLARYVARSPDFRRAVVNRVWSQIFGFGFTSPVDDLGPHNPPSHPELLDELADQFAAHDHDLRALIRWMVSSEPFQLADAPGTDLADAPELGRGRWFSRAYPRSEAKPIAQESLLALAKAARQRENQLGVGTTANLKPTFSPPGRSASNKSISPLEITTQTMPLSASSVPVTIAQILDSAMPVEEKVDHLFLVTLQRTPSKRERSLVATIVGDVQKADRDVLLQIWWTLNRSTE